MNQPIMLRKRQAWPIVSQVFPEYRGRKFKLYFQQHVIFSDLHWAGGTRNSYAFVRADGELAFFPASTPWDSPFEGRKMPLPENILVVEHTMFCGKDLGITIYAHPCWAPRLLEHDLS